MSAPSTVFGNRFHASPWLGQETVQAPVWMGPTPLVLGPGSWGFGIGRWPGTAVVKPIQWPREVKVYQKDGPYGI